MYLCTFESRPNFLGDAMLAYSVSVKNDSHLKLFLLLVLWSMLNVSYNTQPYKNIKMHC